MLDSPEKEVTLDYVYGSLERLSAAVRKAKRDFQSRSHLINRRSMGSMQWRYFANDAVVVVVRAANRAFGHGH